MTLRLKFQPSVSVEEAGCSDDPLGKSAIHSLLYPNGDEEKQDSTHKLIQRLRPGQFYMEGLISVCECGTNLKKTDPTHPENEAAMPEASVGRVVTRRSLCINSSRAAFGRSTASLGNSLVGLNSHLLPHWQIPWEGRQCKKEQKVISKIQNYIILLSLSHFLSLAGGEGGQWSGPYEPAVVDTLTHCLPTTRSRYN